MIWQSVKALDLQRDSRVTIHSLVPDKAHESQNQGDIKLYGRAVLVTEPAKRASYEAAIQARISWQPAEPYHCFAFYIERAGSIWQATSPITPPLCWWPTGNSPSHQGRRFG